MDTLDEGMTHTQGGSVRDGTRFHHTTQNSVHFKTQGLLISGIFRFNIFGPHLTSGALKAKPQETGTTVFYLCDFVDYV